MNILLHHGEQTTQFAELLAAQSTMKKPPRIVGKGNGTPAGRTVIIDCRGVMTKYPTDFSVSTLGLISQVKAAQDDDSISLVIIWVDSPGGEVGGIAELSAAVFDLAKTKTVKVLVDGTCASAALWAVAGATEIYATTRIDVIGSIGAASILVDSSEAAGMSGLKIIRIRSGDLKALGVPGIEITPDEISYLSKMVFVVANEFMRAVSVGRKIPMDQVRAMATGAVWPANEAKRLGLIDGFSSIEELLGSNDDDRSQQVVDQSGSRYAALVAAANEVKSEPQSVLRSGFDQWSGRV